MTFDPAMTLAEAQERLRELAYEGHTCPCCTQFVKVYRWSLYGTAVAMLMHLYRAGGTTEYVESKVAKRGLRPNATPSELRHWGLVEQESERREDGGRSGWWRVTDLGERFVLGQATIPKYAWVYNGRCFKQGGEQVTVHDALGKSFHYGEIMAPAWEGDSIAA